MANYYTKFCSVSSCTIKHVRQKGPTSQLRYHLVPYLRHHEPTVAHLSSAIDAIFIDIQHFIQKTPENVLVSTTAQRSAGTQINYSAAAVLTSSVKKQNNRSPVLMWIKCIKGQFIQITEKNQKKKPNNDIMVNDHIYSYACVADPINVF